MIADGILQLFERGTDVNQATATESKMETKRLRRTNTKIIATFGPAINSPELIAEAIEKGADVFRLNFSHGDYESHAEAVKQIRETADLLGKPVAILQDLRGPKIRLGKLTPDICCLKRGDQVTLFAGEESDDPSQLPVTGYDTLAADVTPGEIVLLNDGMVRLRITDVKNQDRIECEVELGGELSSRKGVNLPDTDLKTLDTITDKDWADLKFGCSLDVDFIALSFVRNANDVIRLKERVREHGKHIPVIAKIEKKEALINLDEIIEAADGIMVARGDLGVETDLEGVVLHQKRIIRACNERGKVVVTATQMLESMVKNPVPTRAEVSDISNAILDGTDAIMLSAETAVGAYPIETIDIMNRIAKRAEGSLDPNQMMASSPFMNDISDAVAHAACVTAKEIEARVVICMTVSGLTARLVSRYRPQCPVVAISPDPRTIRRLALVWGVMPLLVSPEVTEDELIAESLRITKATGLVKPGDRAVITAGVSTGALKGKTNLIRVEIL
jgi:pyruvate kinase